MIGLRKNLGDARKVSTYKKMVKKWTMNKRKYFFKSISNVTLVNMFSMLITAFLTVVLPRYITKVDYGVWQLFVFYQGYLGFLHFGWNDGIYLRYGGKPYSELNKRSFCSQFWMQIIFEMILSMTIYYIVKSQDALNSFVLWQLAMNAVVLNSRYMLIYILQATARIKEYSRVLFVDRFVYILIIIITIILAELKYSMLIYAETVSKVLAYLLAIYYCKDIVFNKLRGWKIECVEIVENVRVGIKIMLSNIASILVIGIIRFGIEQNWGVEIFGEISLTITLSQLFITFITNIGMVIFPILKQMDQVQMKRMYSALNICLSVFLLCGMVLYYPGSILLRLWLPEYQESIKYMGLLLPICYYESKMGLLNNTYMKALRAEKKIMLINCSTMGLAILFSVFFSFGLKNLTLSVLAILLLILIRCNWFDWSIKEIFNNDNRRGISVENCMVVAFVICNYVIGDIIGFVGYTVAALIYLLYRYKVIRQLIREVQLR